eukprot:CAMPEP_0184695562 /NCGR_PEP_ID=MMETSP0313-20130426/3162_1 /TAXON_ID=2792 /ORGANISM="Porphyridium aerugineum, Strain SAG 1380-2" /LENGTH=327 /DNA_ID=CAMNT_0027154051 /DNA_START=25 /DNA_END=1005 /DNA_ORIENTATION=+
MDPSLSIFATTVDGVLLPDSNLSFLIDLGYRNDMTLREFGSMFERAAYTTSSSCWNRKSLIHTPFHISRLLESYEAIAREEQPNQEIQIPDPQVILESIQVVLNEIDRKCVSTDRPSTLSEALVFICIPVVYKAGIQSASTGLDLGLPHIFVRAMASESILSKTPEPVTVELRPFVRHLAYAKDTSWISRRKVLESIRDPRASETILYEHSTGHVLEGTITNFYVILKSGEVVTADDLILKGHIRSLVLDIAEKSLGKPILLHPARMNQVRQWDAAFITNAFHMVTPVKTILVPIEDMEKCEVDIVDEHDKEDGFWKTEMNALHPTL